MKDYIAHKKAVISAQNTVNAFVNHAAPIYLAAMKPFVGKQIRYKNGGLMEDFHEAMAAVEAELEMFGQPIKNLSFHLSNLTSYCVELRANVFVDLNDGYGGHYCKQSFILGNLERVTGILQNLYDLPEYLPQYITDFTLEVVENELKEIARLQNVIDAKKFKIDPFGNGVNVD